MLCSVFWQGTAPQTLDSIRGWGWMGVGLGGWGMWGATQLGPLHLGGTGPLGQQKVQRDYAGRVGLQQSPSEQ